MITLRWRRVFGLEDWLNTLLLRVWTELSSYMDYNHIRIFNGKCGPFTGLSYTPGQPCLTVTSKCILDHKMGSFCIYKQLKMKHLMLRIYEKCHSP